MRALVSLYEEDPTTLARALDVCQELKALPQVTNLPKSCGGLRLSRSLSQD